jgi:hypothetical protein
MYRESDIMGEKKQQLDGAKLLQVVVSNISLAFPIKSIDND